MSGAEGRHRVRDNMCQVKLNVAVIGQDWRRARLLVWQKTPRQVECKTQKEGVFYSVRTLQFGGYCSDTSARRAVSLVC